MNDDLISRQATIEAVKRLSLGETDATRLAMRIGDYLERLQSAQHEPLTVVFCSPRYAPQGLTQTATSGADFGVCCNPRSELDRKFFIWLLRDP